MDPGHPWGTESPQKRAWEPDDPQKACKMEPKLSSGPSKSTLWATILLPKCSQNGSRLPMGPQKRAQEPEDPQKASKMEPKLSPGPLKSSLWATISLPKCSQNGSRPPMGHMEPTEACPEAPEAPNDSQHGAKTQPNAPVHQLPLGTVLICLSLFSKRHPCHNVDCMQTKRRKEFPRQVIHA